VWLVLPVFVVVMMVLEPLPGGLELWKLARIFSEVYGGIFATLWLCDMMIAWRWKAPDKLFKKTLLRTLALWLWPMGFDAYNLVRALLDPLFRAEIHVQFGVFMQRYLWDLAGHGLMFFAAIVVPLMVCELLMARFRRGRVKQ